MIWKGTYLSIWSPTVDSAFQSKNQTMRSKELSVALRDRIVSAQIWGRGTKTFLQHWRSPRTQWPPSFWNGRSLEPPRLFLELAAWPNWAIRGEGPWSGRWPASGLEETWHHPFCEAWWWQHHALLMFYMAGTERLVRIEEKMNGTKYREFLDENLLQSAQDLGPVRRFTLQQDNDAKHTAKPMQEWLRQVSECPWVAQPETGLESNQTSLERPENSCAATLPIHPDRAWEDLHRRMGETLQIQVCQACSIIPKKT